MKYTVDDLRNDVEQVLWGLELSEEIKARNAERGDHMKKNVKPLEIVVARDPPLVNFQKARIAFQNIKKNKGRDYGLISEAVTRYEIAVDDLRGGRLHRANGHSLLYELDIINAYLAKRPKSTS